MRDKTVSFRTGLIFEKKKLRYPRPNPRFPRQWDYLNRDFPASPSVNRSPDNTSCRHQLNCLVFGFFSRSPRDLGKGRWGLKDCLNWLLDLRFDERLVPKAGALVASFWQNRLFVFGDLSANVDRRATWHVPGEFATSSRCMKICVLQLVPH